MRRNIVLVTLSAGLIAALVLYLVFRSAQARISRQTEALVEAVQRDTLTGTLNHGALVEAVAARDRGGARSTSAAIGVALVDIDNFRLLNENYGHEAGDEALLTVVEVLEREAAAGRGLRPLRSRRAPDRRPGRRRSTRIERRPRAGPRRRSSTTRSSSTRPSGCR